MKTVREIVLFIIAIWGALLGTCHEVEQRRERQPLIFVAAELDLADPGPANAGPNILMWIRNLGREPVTITPPVSFVKFHDPDSTSYEHVINWINSPEVRVSSGATPVKGPAYLEPNRSIHLAVIQRSPDILLPSTGPLFVILHDVNGKEYQAHMTEKRTVGTTVHYEGIAQ